MKELVVQGKPFYSAMDMGARALKRKVGTGSEFLKELMALPGVKPTELKERGLEGLMNEPKMTHEQFLSALMDKPVPSIFQKVLGEKPEPPPREVVRKSANKQIRSNARDYANMKADTSAEYRTLASDEMRRLRGRHMPQIMKNLQEELQEKAEPYHHKGYTLPGGENYREMLIKAPNKKKIEENFRGLSSHFGGEKNILASMRLKDRITPEGKKLLHLEELQSDWHQEGRNQGYHQNLTELPEGYKVVPYTNISGAKDYHVLDENGNVFASGLNAETANKNALENLNRGTRVPDAPFKKNWEEMAIKRLIHHAAERGYHGIVVTPGQEQADRYGLSKSLHILSVYKNKNGKYSVSGYEHGTDTTENPEIEHDDIPEEKLKDYIGNDLAKKAITEGGGEYRGLDLDVGGEGMKGFYDKKVPNIFNAVGKKHGVKMELHGHPIETEPKQKFGNDSFSFGSPPKTTNVHHFPITEPMREDVLKNGLPLYNTGGVIHKAEGGNVQPSIEQMRMALNQNRYIVPKSDIQSIGANEAPSMQNKVYINPGQDGNPSVGGVDMNSIAPGMQMMKQDAPPMTPPNQQPPSGQSTQSPLGGAPSSPLGAPPSNILQMTPQGQAMNAMTPPQQLQPPQGMAKGGATKSVEDMKAELSKKKTEKSKRVEIKAEGSGGVKGIVVPRHLIEGNPKASAEGLKNMMDARAKIYGSEHREPLTLGQIARIHKETLEQHFAKPREEQLHEEQSALNRIRSAKFIKHNRDTLDESEKLDTVNHEHDSQGRSHVGYASKGVAGHALFPQGHGKDMDYKVINTCPGQTEGCGGGTDAKGVVDTSKGTCFAPNAESQYAAAASRRAGHAIAKHDPRMTQDWILAHTGSLRNASDKADKQNKRMLFRPNVVDETDVSSRHAIRHLNEQRKEEGKPPIIANSYGKTNELHDPENGYHVTHSNVGPKTKQGSSIAENISRDKARVRNTITASDNKGDFTNEQGHKTPPKGSYMVTDVRRGSPMSKNMESAITHAKYWSTGRPESELTKEEKEEGHEGHFNGSGNPTTEDKAHYGHKTVKDLRFDYQKQHILHPRLVQVGKNDDGTPHMIPTDSRFKDTEFLPKNRFKTKNGKEAGHILMTTPTESTSNLGHQTSFTHHVGEGDIQHAKKNKGEYVIDSPEEQIKSQGKEYSAPQPIKIIRKADGGSIGGRHIGYSDDDFHAFPEQNPIAQRHLAMRRGDDESMPYHAPKHKVTIHNNMDTMLLELMRKK